VTPRALDKPWELNSRTPLLQTPPRPKSPTLAYLIQAVFSMAELPPPYSATVIPQNHGPQRDAVVQLRRYLIEIMAFTFNADIALLNHTLGKPLSLTSTSTSTTNSTLTTDERVELLRLACISKDLYGKHTGYQFLTTRESDRRAVADAIVMPALELDLSAGYIVELISTYADHQCDETKRKHTLVSLSIPCLLWLFRRLAVLGLAILGHHLDSHARIVGATAPNEDVRMVLGNAMKAFQEEELGIKKIPHSYYDSWPNDFRLWHDLCQVLISDEEEMECYRRLAVAERKAGSNR
jgi:hypothetical protein